MEAHHEMNRRNTVVKRAIVVAISVILALVVAAPIASGQSSFQSQTQSQNLAQLTAESWNWAISNPSPLEGSYKGGARCNGEYVKGVIFLAGALGGSSVDRTCTVPANTPILFSPFNYLCSAAFDPIQEVDDPQPYDTACAKPTTDATIDPPSSFYARVDGKDANQQRIASGLFQWTIPVHNILGLPAGTYEAAQDGLWVYLENGLNKGQHTVQFGGTFKNTPFNDPPGSSFEGTKVTYKLTAR
jgi:hypothetical protein